VLEKFDQWDDWFGKNNKIYVGDDKNYIQNMGVVLKSEATEAVPKAKDHGIVKGEYIVHLKQYHPCKVKPANTEQTIALELLRDDTIPLVTMLGAAGGGKTYLACAHALHALQKEQVSRVIIAKSLVPVGKDVGYLKGDLLEKVKPWLGSFYDNFLKLGKSNFEIDNMITSGKIEISPITFIQGRSISDAELIIDEIQNLDLLIIKQIITRAGSNCKVLLLGDPSQRFERGSIDLPLLVDKCKSSSLTGHIYFRKSIRSPLAQWAVENL